MIMVYMQTIEMLSCGQKQHYISYLELHLSLFVSGILCGTLTSKKKKRMMYLTAKNAGNTPN